MIGFGCENFLTNSNINVEMFARLSVRSNTSVQYPIAFLFGHGLSGNNELLKVVDRKEIHFFRRAFSKHRLYIYNLVDDLTHDEELFSFNFV